MFHYDVVFWRGKWMWMAVDKQLICHIWNYYVLPGCYFYQINYTDVYLPQAMDK